MVRLTMVVAAMLTLGAGMPATAAEKVAPPAAAVRGHSVVRDGVTVRVPKSAKFVGAERFDLYGVADAEIEVFAEADRNMRLTKLYWIQFESYWPDLKDKTYNYTGDRRERYWGNTVWVNSGPGTTAGAREGGDRDHVQKLLERAGYTVQPEMMNVRMVQILDDPKGTGHGRHELMFIYAEDLKASGKTLAEWEKEPDAAWAPIDKGLVKRATTAFSVERK